MTTELLPFYDGYAVAINNKNIWINVTLGSDF